MWHITTFYRFLPIAAEGLEGIVATWTEFLESRQVVGTLLVAEEGINATLAGSESAIRESQVQIRAEFGGSEVRFKDSTAAKQPFRKLVVETRPEIVGMKRRDLVPTEDQHRHLTPQEWHEWLNSDRPKFVLDTRNRYETFAGKFRGAIDPGLDRFSDFGNYLRSGDVPKDVPVLIYCTGGIRCEKAILEMEAQGFQDVYQLRDGILGYLQEFPEGEWEGECFVFDDRIAVDANLQPTERFGLCAGCGSTLDRRQTASVGLPANDLCDRCQSKQSEP